MPMYRKKPVVTEAFKFTNNEMGHTVSIPVWFLKAIQSGVVFTEGSDTLIKTPVGNHRIAEGNYVIQGVKGELYLCKPDVFEATYEDA